MARKKAVLHPAAAGGRLQAFGLFGRKKAHDTGVSHAAQQLRIQTLNRYGITSYDFGTRYLQQGCVGDDVAALQQYLRQEGLMRGDDAYAGYFGEATEAAVIKWQQKNHLPATGAFGDLARETYLQKQELRLQDTISASTQVPAEEVAVLQQLEPQVPAPLPVEAAAGMSWPLRLLSLCVLAAAVLVGQAAVRAWLARRQSGEEYPSSWQGDLSALKNQWGLGTPAEQEAQAGAEAGQGAGSPVIVNSLFSVPDAVPEESNTQYAVQSPHGTYFNPAQHETLRRELAQRSSAGDDGGSYEAATNGSNGSYYEQAQAPARGVRLTDQRRAAAANKPPVAEPGSYFGGAVRRPFFQPPKNAVKHDGKSPGKKAELHHEDEVQGKSGWDAWTPPAADAGVTADKEVVEPLAPNWAVKPALPAQNPFTALKPAASPVPSASDRSSAALPRPSSDSVVSPLEGLRGSSPSSDSAIVMPSLSSVAGSGVAGGLSSEKARPPVRAEDVSAQVKRLAAKGKGGGEIWVSNTRYSPDGKPIDKPITRPALNSTNGAIGITKQPDIDVDDRPSGKGDYKILTATPAKKAMPPRATSAPLYAKLLQKKYQNSSGAAGGVQKDGRGSSPGSAGATIRDLMNSNASTGSSNGANGSNGNGSKHREDSNGSQASEEPKPSASTP